MNRDEQRLQMLFNEEFGPGTVTPDDMRKGTAHIAAKLRRLGIVAKDVRAVTKAAQYKSIFWGELNVPMSVKEYRHWTQEDDNGE